eukprot:13218993-Alexandrium_andersonii.AAC.1
MMPQQLGAHVSEKARISSPCTFIGSERASWRRSIAVSKTFQHLSQASKLGGPGSFCRTHAPKATLKEKATWLSACARTACRAGRTGR